MPKPTKNPVYWNAAVRLSSGENSFSCNCVVNEVLSQANKCTYDKADYALPEVQAYKQAMGFRTNGPARFRMDWFKPLRSDPANLEGAKTSDIRLFALLLAYESGVGRDLIA